VIPNDLTDTEFAVASKSFECSCKDYKLHANKQKKVCKHICFIVCKFARIMDPHFFETKMLTREQFEHIVQSARLLESDRSVFQKQETFSDCFMDLSGSVISKFTILIKPIMETDTCPICFDNFGSDQSLFVNCPDCHNVIHKQCINVWLEKKSTCVFCRSDVWTKYKKWNK
jgi:hypothetical protein